MLFLCPYTAGNSAYQGGAMKLPQLSQYGNVNYVNILECSFERNIADTGAALHIKTFIPGLLNETVDNTIWIHVNSSSFSWNTGRRGVVFFGFNHVKFTGINNFCKNIGPSLTILLSLKLDQFGIIVIALYRSVAIGEGKPSITGGNI